MTSVSSVASASTPNADGEQRPTIDMTAHGQRHVRTLGKHCGIDQQPQNIPIGMQIGS
jgi:hypothetical protein